MTYSCYDDGTIVAVNPRSELFCESYAEQNGEVCASTYVKTFSQVIISGCDHVSTCNSFIRKIHTLRKPAYAIYRDFSSCKNRKFHWKKIKLLFKTLIVGTR